MKKWSNILREETGQAMTAVLAMLALGSLMVVPSLNFAATNLKAERTVEAKAKALYTAEAGVNDAIWRLKYTSPTIPYSFNITGLNTMSAVVVIEDVTQIAGEEIGPTGVHEGWLKITRSATYSAGVYTYYFTMKNSGSGNMKIEEILVDLPPGVSYITGSTSGNVTSDNPTVISTPDVGITLVWHIPSPYYTMGQNETQSVVFRLSGAAGIEGVEGHSFVKATREDVGTVWDADSRPYSITSRARDSKGTLLATVVAGIWKGQTTVEISGWLINP